MTFKHIHCWAVRWVLPKVSRCKTASLCCKFGNTTYCLGLGSKLREKPQCHEKPSVTCTPAPRLTSAQAELTCTDCTHLRPWVVGKVASCGISLASTGLLFNLDRCLMGKAPSLRMKQTPWNRADLRKFRRWGWLAEALSTCYSNSAFPLSSLPYLFPTHYNQ